MQVPSRARMRDRTLADMSPVYHFVQLYLELNLPHQRWKHSELHPMPLCSTFGIQRVLVQLLSQSRTQQ
jgi:hypothetical protein